MKRLLNRIRRDERGAAAVEMAMILPFLAVATIMSVSVWDVGMRSQDLHGALKITAQYYLNGGQDDTAAEELGLASWHNKPAGATFVISRACKCAQVAQACTVNCSNGIPPATYVVMTATATDSTATLYPTQTAQESVRVH
jgi:Flp pilus assembly protein TadG